MVHVGPLSRRHYLVRYLGFPASLHEWKSPSDVTQVLVDAYEELLREAAPRQARSGGAKAELNKRVDPAVETRAIKTKSGRVSKPTNRHRPK